MSRLFLLLSLGGLLLLVNSCKKDSDDPIVEVTDPGNDPSSGSVNSTSEVNVPDGFNYAVATDVFFNMNFKNDSDLPVDSVKYTILGVNHYDQTETIFHGTSGSDPFARFNLPIPFHFKSIVIKTERKGNTKYFEYLVTKDIEVNLKTNGFNDNAGDPRANNCYPSINNTFTNDGTGFTVNTDQEMTSIEITYTDGTTETVTVNSNSYSK
ncbi:MAG: hypothetical protein AB8F74_16195 [Saprospiraceae bacterium]